MKTTHLYLLLLGMAACSSPSETREPAATATLPEGSVVLTPAQLEKFDLGLDTLRIERLATEITVPGKVVVLSHSQAQLSSPLTGTIAELHVHEGERVAKGGALITLESLELVRMQQGYLEAKAEAIYLTAERARQEALLAARVGAEAEAQQVRARYQTAEARRKALAEQLRLVGIDTATLATAERARLTGRFTLRAPLSGYVFKLPATLGQQVQPGSELIHVISLSDLHADLALTESQVQGVREGQRVQIEFTSAKVPPTHGRVEYVGRAVEPDARTVTAHVHIDPLPGYYVLPDMTVRARLRGESTQPTPTLPITALVQLEREALIYAATPVAEGMRFDPVSVEVVNRQGERMGLALRTQPISGQRYATRNVLLLRAEAGRESD